MKPMYKCKITVKINDIDSKDHILEEVFDSLDKSNRFSERNGWFNYMIKRLETEYIYCKLL